MKNLIFWIAIMGCLINNTSCQKSGSNKEIDDEFIVIAAIAALLIIFVLILCCCSKLHEVGSADVEMARNDSIFVIETTLKDEPPKYCELRCETPPPSFDSVFPVSLDIISDDKTDHQSDLQLITSIDTICDKL